MHGPLAPRAELLSYLTPARYRQKPLSAGLSPILSSTHSLPDGSGERCVMQQDKRLKRCPFCGSADVFTERADYVACYVRCNDCSARGPIETQLSDREAMPGRAAARKAWNNAARTQRGSGER